MLEPNYDHHAHLYSPPANPPENEKREEIARDGSTIVPFRIFLRDYVTEDRNATHHVLTSFDLYAARCSGTRLNRESRVNKA